MKASSLIDQLSYYVWFQLGSYSKSSLFWFTQSRWSGPVCSSTRMDEVDTLSLAEDFGGAFPEDAVAAASEAAPAPEVVEIKGDSQAPDDNIFGDLQNAPSWLTTSEDDKSQVGFHSWLSLLPRIVVWQLNHNNVFPLLEIVT